MVFLQVLSTDAVCAITRRWRTAVLSVLTNDAVQLIVVIGSVLGRIGEIFPGNALFACVLLSLVSVPSKIANGAKRHPRQTRVRASEAYVTVLNVIRSVSKLTRALVIAVNRSMAALWAVNTRGIRIGIVLSRPTPCAVSGTIVFTHCSHIQVFEPCCTWLASCLVGFVLKLV